MSTAASGDRKRALPSRCDLKWTPSSVILRRAGEAEHLVSAAVGQDRAVPADEPVQPAAPRDELFAGTQVQVIGVAEDDSRAGVDRRARCVSALTAPCVPTGMKTGVSTTPWRWCSRPRRARAVGGDELERKAMVGA